MDGLLEKIDGLKSLGDDHRRINEMHKACSEAERFYGNRELHEAFGSFMMCSLFFSRMVWGGDRMRMAMTLLEDGQVVRSVFNVWDWSIDAKVVDGFDNTSLSAGIGICPVTYRMLLLSCQAHLMYAVFHKAHELSVHYGVPFMRTKDCEAAMDRDFLSLCNAEPDDIRPETVVEVMGRYADRIQEQNRRLLDARPFAEHLLYDFRNGVMAREKVRRTGSAYRAEDGREFPVSDYIASPVRDTEKMAENP